MALTVAVAGLGTIGLPVARALNQGIHGLELTAISSGRTDHAAERLQQAGIDVPVVKNSELPDYAEVIVECAPKKFFRDVAEPALTAGRLLISVSGAAILEEWDLVALAERTGGRIHLVTGALLGLDAVRAAAEGVIHAVHMTTRKPPKSLIGAPYLVDNKIDVTSLTEPVRVFEGTAREGARGFPANVNVAAALSLAGIGPDEMRLEIWADPALERNTHFIEVEADSARFAMSIENVPSAENPGTGVITPLSVIAALRGLTAPLKVGT